MLVQLVPVGANFTWPNPLLALEVIEPLWPVVTSLSPILRPCAVSCIVTMISSPAFMNRSAAELGVKVLIVALTGLGGEAGCGRPFLVVNAKLTDSTAVLAAQLELNRL